MNKVFGILLVGLLVVVVASGTHSFASGYPSCDPTVVQRKCYGALQYSNGRQYLGEIFNGKAHGEGKMIFPNGAVQIGMFSYGAAYATGSYLQPDGTSFIGKYSAGERSGFGVENFKNGDKFLGYWSENKRNGPGRMIFRSGETREGIWIGAKLFIEQVVRLPDESTIVPPRDITRKYQNKPDTIQKKPTQDPSKVVAAATGSGFAVSADGYVITNHHVINGCQKVFVHTNGKAIPTDLVTYDQQNDLALT